MKNRNHEPAEQRKRVKAFFYALIYVVLAGLWILLSGSALDFLAGLTEVRADLEIYKGLLFVMITGVGLYVLLRSWQGEMQPGMDFGEAARESDSRQMDFRLPIIYLLAMVIIVAVGGYVVFERLKQGESAMAEQNLSAVANLKAEQIGGWLKENHNYAMAAGDGSHFADSFALWVRSGKLSHEREQWMRDRMKTLQDGFPYGELALVSPDGKPYLSTGTMSDTLVEHALTLLPLVRATGRPVIGKMDWHQRPDGTKYVSLPMAAPLISSRNGREVVGLLMFELNPERYLFPQLESWPMASQSAEIAMLRVDGENVLQMNEMRLGKDTALTQVNIAVHPEQIVARAALRQSGFLNGIDYRGIPVSGYVAPVSGTDWLVVAKVDTDEIQQPISRIARNVTLAAFLLALVGSLSLYFWWRQRKVWYEAAQMAARLQQQMLGQQVDILSKYANDAMLLLDEGAVIVEANDRSESMYGYTRQELIGMSAFAFRAPDESFDMEHFRRLFVERKGSLFEVRHRRRDGTVFPAEVSARLIETDRGSFVQCIIRDISERKLQEAREQRLMNMYRALSETNDAILRLEEESALFPLACRIAVELGGMSLAWVGVPDAAGARILPVASHGAAEGYLAGIQISLSPDDVAGQGPTAIAFRGTRAVVINDFVAATITRPWHESAQKYGIRAAAAFPITRAGKPYAAFTVYSDQINYFDDEIVRLLKEISANLSFALDNFNRETSRHQAEISLRQNEARFRRVAEEAPFPMMVCAEDGEILQLNRAWAEITGYSPADIRTMQDWIVHAYEEDASTGMETVAQMFGIEHRFDSGERTVRCKDGSRRVWHFVSSPLGRLPDNRRFIISMATDITESKKAEEGLRMAATVFESSHSGIVITDSQVRIIAVNPAFTEMTGYSTEEVIGRNPGMLKSGRQGEDFYRIFWQELTKNGHWQGEMWNRRKSGEEYASWLSISALHDDKGRLVQYIGISDDITELRESQNRIEYLAYHDSLTGLPNRVLANDRLKQAIAHAYRSKNRVAVMLLDLDDFKTINDTLGHSTGDLMLKAVADRLRKCVRPSDTVSRQGGDEFLVMLDDVADIDAINNAAVDILEKIRRPFSIEGHELSTSTSIGVAIYPEDGQDCDTLLKNADMAMYNAKQAGRNTHSFFSEKMNDYVLEHLLIRNGLMRALENSEFVLHYQPQLELNTGALIGVEALIRWQHPELGMIPPNRFIQVAEESGMIIPIGEWVLREACRQMVIWHQAGWPDLVVGVNISAVQFRRGDLDRVVSAALSEFGLAPQYLELELTESILIQDVENSLDTINRLKNLGVQLLIDDFGTGYSSLAYLRRLPVDKLKIDQSFVRDITTRKDDAAIALSIITLAHTLQKWVIAEGVETIEQLNFLRDHACDEIQGYLLSRPLPPAEFAQMLKQGISMDLLLKR